MDIQHKHKATCTPSHLFLCYRPQGWLDHNVQLRLAEIDHPREAKIEVANQLSVLKLEASMVVDDAPEVQVYRPISGERIADLVRNFVAHSIELRKKSVAKYRNALQSFDKWTKHKHDSLIRAND